MEREEFKRAWAARVAGYEAAERRADEFERIRTPDDRFRDLLGLGRFLPSCAQQSISEREAESHIVRSRWNRLRSLYARA